MLKKAIIAAIIIFGVALVFAELLREGEGPRATFTLDGAQIAWLAGQPGHAIDMTETGVRDVEGARVACHAVRNATFQGGGRINVRQVCTDDEGRAAIDSTEGTWRVTDERLCLDLRPLDRDPECWKIIYRDGTLEFINGAETLRWFGTPALAAGESDEMFLDRLQNAGASR